MKRQTESVLKLKTNIFFRQSPPFILFAFFFCLTNSFSNATDQQQTPGNRKKNSQGMVPPAGHMHFPLQWRPPVLALSPASWRKSRADSRKGLCMSLVRGCDLPPHRRVGVGQVALSTLSSDFQSNVQGLS